MEELVENGKSLIVVSSELPEAIGLSDRLIVMSEGRITKELTDREAFDSGSTVLRMVKYLKNKDITIVTTNAMILPKIQETKLKCFLAGGEINVSTASILGTKTNSDLSTMYFDKAFLGANGFSDKAGISTPDVREAEKKQIVHRNSTETYVLLDSSKSGRNTLSKVFDLGEVTVICDKETDMLAASGNYIIAK